jgi:rod shape-determining protein MreB
VERRAVSDAVRRAGAREVFLVQEPMAAAIGSGLPVEEPKGSMIIDIGGGTTEVAIISLSGIVVGRSLKVAGDELDQAVINFARENYHLHLGERTAEAVKIKVGEACRSRGKKREVMMRGRDLKTGLPKSVVVSSEEIGMALHGPLATIIASVKDILEDSPPELIPDILDQGIILAGGMSQLRGMAQRFSRELEAPVRVAEDPITCVARGAGVLLDNPRLLAKVKV